MMKLLTRDFHSKLDIIGREGKEYDQLCENIAKDMLPIFEKRYPDKLILRHSVNNMQAGINDKTLLECDSFVASLHDNARPDWDMLSFAAYHASFSIMYALCRHAIDSDYKNSYDAHFTILYALKSYSFNRINKDDAIEKINKIIMDI